MAMQISPCCDQTWQPGFCYSPLANTASASPLGCDVCQVTGSFFVGLGAYMPLALLECSGLQGWKGLVYLYICMR